MSPPRSCSGCMAPPLPKRHPLEVVGRDGHRVALCRECLAAVEAATPPGPVAGLVGEALDLLTGHLTNEARAEAIEALVACEEILERQA